MSLAYLSFFHFSYLLAFYCLEQVFGCHKTYHSLTADQIHNIEIVEAINRTINLQIFSNLKTEYTQKNGGKKIKKYLLQDCYEILFGMTFVICAISTFREDLLQLWNHCHQSPKSRSVKYPKEGKFELLFFYQVNFFIHKHFSTCKIVHRFIETKTFQYLYIF